MKESYSPQRHEEHKESQSSFVSEQNFEKQNPISKIIVELKSVERLLAIHEAQTLTYLKLSKHKMALLINFSTPLIKDGIKRFVI